MPINLLIQGNEILRLTSNQATNNMNPQQQQVFEYSQEMNIVEQQDKASQQVATQTATPSTTTYQDKF